MAKNEAKIKFNADVKGFNDAIGQANREMAELRAEMRLNETQMKDTGETTEGLQKKHDILENQLKASEAKTEALNQKVKKAAEIFGENSDEASKLKIQLLNAQNAEEKLKQAVGACEKEINELSNELEENKKDLDKTEKSAKELDKTYDDLGEGAGNVGEKMKVAAAGIAALGAGAVAFGKSAMDAFNEVKEGADNVVRATGATGEAADELAEVYENVASQVVGSFDEMGSMVGEINTRFGYTGEQLETASLKFQKFADITGVDATEAVKLVTRAMNDAGIPLEEYDGMLDQLAKAGQAAGIDVATMADSLSKNGATMRAMGLDTEETIAMLAQFELSGADTSTMLVGMKKAFQTWTESGKDGNKEFGKMVKGIQDGSVSASDAMDVFGKKAGPQLVDAIKSGKFEYEDMLKIIQDSKGTVEGTFDETVDGGYQLDLAFQNCKMAMAEAGDVLGTTLAPAFQTLSENTIPKVVEGFHSFVEKTTDAVKWMKEHKGVVIAITSAIGILAVAIGAYNIVQGIKTAMDAANVTTVWALVAAHWAQATAAMAAIAPYVLIVAAIAAVIAIIVLCVKHWDTIKKKTAEVWKAIKESVVKAAKAVKEKVVDIKNSITKKLSEAKKKAVEIFENMKKSISEKAAKIKEKIVNIFNKVLGFFKKNWKGLLLLVVNPFAGAFKLAYDNCEGFRNKVNKFISKVKSLFKKGFEYVKNKIVTPIANAKNKAISTIEGLRSSFFSKVQSIKDKATSVFSSIKDKIVNPIQNAKKDVSSAVDRIKGIFDFSWSIPKPKIPKFSVSGGKAPWGFGGKGKLPSVDVKWNAAGGILTKPTIFGALGSTLMGGGEAGHEAILPIKVLQDYINRAFDRNVYAYAAAGGTGDVYNFYVNDAKINDNAQMREVTKDFITEMVRLGGMNR